MKHDNQTNMLFTAIDSFSDEFDFLSNFAPVEVTFEGMKFPSVEHAYQAAKTNDFDDRASISKAATPGQAKKMGRNVTLRKDFEEKKLEIMERLVREKFSKRGFKILLLNTGERQLIEGNWWGDTFWGVCKKRGENHLGKILMKIRDELRSE